MARSLARSKDMALGGTTWGIDCQYCPGSQTCGIVLASYGQRDGVCRGSTGRL